MAGYKTILFPAQPVTANNSILPDEFSSSQRLKMSKRLVLDS